jgi:hypothetical protein
LQNRGDFDQGWLADIAWISEHPFILCELNHWQWNASSCAGGSGLNRSARTTNPYAPFRPKPACRLDAVRREAQRRRLPFTGTLGVLAAGAEQGLLNLRNAVDLLRQTSFHISPDILDRFIGSQ